MNIRIVNYKTSISPSVQAFVDIEIDCWLKFNGLNFLRDGTVRSAQLTPRRNGKRLFRDAVQVLDADLSSLLVADILAAIQAYIALLPPERRMRPPAPPRPKPEISAAGDERRSAATPRKSKRAAGTEIPADSVEDAAKVTARYPPGKAFAAAVTAIGAGGQFADASEALTPAVPVKSRPNQHSLQREVFTISRELEYFTADELTKQTGYVHRRVSPLSKVVLGPPDFQVGAGASGGIVESRAIAAIPAGYGGLAEIKPLGYRH